MSFIPLTGWVEEPANAEGKDLGFLDLDALGTRISATNLPRLCLGMSRRPSTRFLKETRALSLILLIRFLRVAIANGLKKNEFRLQSRYGFDWLRSNGSIGKKPMCAKIRFQSNVKHYGITGDGKPFRSDNESCLLYEHYEPPPHKDLSEGIGKYSIVLERDVQTATEVEELRMAATQLIEEITFLWPYVAGEPFDPIFTQISLWHEPPGWVSNSDTVKEELQIASGEIYAKLRIKQNHWLVLPYFPLGLVLLAREKYPNFTKIYKTLISIHHQALSSTLTDARLFLLAKALELVMELIPGNTRNQKTKKMPDRMRDNLKQRDLDWHFRIANTRVNVRHVILQKGANPDLHPQITPSESRDFQHDIDYMIRYFVAEKFGYAAGVFQENAPEIGVVCKQPTQSVRTGNPVRFGG